MLANQRDFSDVDSGDSLAQTRGDSGGALDPKLRGMLTDLRKEVSAEKGLPPYVIFQDISLDEMATHYPMSPDELLRITGVGSGKAAKFGEPFTHSSRSTSKTRALNATTRCSFGAAVPSRATR